MPVHGEYRMLKLHSELAAKVGVPLENSFVLKNGETLELRNGKVTRGRSFAVADIYIDGNSTEGMSKAVLTDRRQLNQDGMVAVLIAVDPKNNELLVPVEIYSRGFINWSISNLLPDAEKHINKILNRHYAEKVTTFGEVKNIVREELEPFFFAKTGRKPMIIPVIMSKGL
jgi:ribonuclease J